MRSTFFLKKALSFMFDRILNVTLSNNFSKLDVGLRRGSPPLVLLGNRVLLLPPYSLDLFFIYLSKSLLTVGIQK